MPNLNPKKQILEYGLIFLWSFITVSPAPFFIGQVLVNELFGGFVFTISFWIILAIFIIRKRQDKGKNLYSMLLRHAKIIGILYAINFLNTFIYYSIPKKGFLIIFYIYIHITLLIQCITIVIMLVYATLIVYKLYVMYKRSRDYNDLEHAVKVSNRFVFLITTLYISLACVVFYVYNAW